MGIAPCNVLGTIAKMEWGDTQVNGPKDKLLTKHKVLHTRYDTNRLSIYQEKMEEDDLAALKITWVHECEDLKITLKEHIRSNYSS